jgi:hypothetical protein
LIVASTLNAAFGESVRASARWTRLAALMNLLDLG